MSKISVNALNVQALMVGLYVIDSEKIIIAKYLLRNMGSYLITDDTQLGLGYQRQLIRTYRLSRLSCSRHNVSQPLL